MNYSGGHIDDYSLCYFAEGLHTDSDIRDLTHHTKRCAICRWKVENWQEYLAIDPDERKNHWTNRKPDVLTRS